MGIRHYNGSRKHSRTPPHWYQQQQCNPRLREHQPYSRPLSREPLKEMRGPSFLLTFLLQSSLKKSRSLRHKRSGLERKVI